jgi:beta-glucosidase
MDRWERRQKLVVEQLDNLRPDVLALNEIDMPTESARWLQRVSRERLGLRYSLLQQSQVNALSEIGGQALLVRFPVVESANLDYRSLDRVAQVARLDVDGTLVDVYVTHLQAGGDQEADRQVQVERLLRWIDSRDDIGARVICGDFNATPEAPSVREMAARFQSVQSAPTASTLNTPPEKRGSDWRPLSKCIDYIWVGGSLTVQGSGLCFDRPHADDPGLWPSDHVGVWADLDTGAAAP